CFKLYAVVKNSITYVPPRTVVGALFSFFLTLQRHPPSTLFPYTTLFRSPALDLHSIALAAHALNNFLTVSGGVVNLLIPILRGQDRKSTRLNSSHDQISYAVLCLKKKK